MSSSDVFARFEIEFWRVLASSGLRGRPPDRPRAPLAGPRAASGVQPAWSVVSSAVERPEIVMQMSCYVSNCRDSRDRLVSVS